MQLLSGRMAEGETVLSILLIDEYLLILCIPEKLIINTALLKTGFLDNRNIGSENG